jgi:phage terminase large subunit GpA-like protein
MTIYPAWAGSIATMNSFPMKRVYWDEVRLMNLTIKSESNAIKLGQDRLTTYLDYGIGQGYMVSSPSTEGDLLHQQLTVPGTLVVAWQIQCPECGEYQPLDFFVNIKFNPESKKVACVCRACSTEFTDSDKKRLMNANGKYARVHLVEGKMIHTRINPDGTREEDFDYFAYKRVFFHWESCASPFRKFELIWKEFLNTKDKLHDYKNFWQCWLARFWIDDKSKTNVSVLRDRMISYEQGIVPDWCKVLTAGIDTQDKGFYVTVRAWGLAKQTHLVDCFMIPCDLAIAEAKDVVKLFNSYIFERTFLCQGPPSKATKWRVAMAAIDTGGHRTKQIYSASDKLPKLLLVKGIGKAQEVTITYNANLNLYLVRTDEYLDETDEVSLKEHFTLFQDAPNDYLSQFCAIRKTELKNKKTGNTEIVWKKLGQCDYRLAEVHAWICIDIPTSKGVLRHLLENERWVWNPFMDRLPLSNGVVGTTNATGVTGTQDMNDGSDYRIQGFDW